MVSVEITLSWTVPFSQVSACLFVVVHPSYEP